MLSLYVSLGYLLDQVGQRIKTRLDTNEKGQGTTEYALVLLGAAAVALIIGVWSRKTNLVGKLMDSVLQFVIGKVT